MAKQYKLNLYKGTHGGRRPNAGRKRLHSKGVAHSKRENVNKRTPLHINFKYKCQIKNKHSLKFLKLAIENAQKQGLRILHYSLQSNHVHLITEADNNEILSRGMRSLTNTLAKRFKRGRIQIERYHLHVLKTLREAKNAIHYVLFNEQKHAPTSAIDEFSSILYLKEAPKLIAEYAKKNHVLLKIMKPRDHFEISYPMSYLAKSSL